MEAIFTERDLLTGDFYLKQWQGNGYYPLYRITKGKLYRIKNVGVVTPNGVEKMQKIREIFEGATVEYILYVLNNNYFIKASNHNPLTFD